MSHEVYFLGNPHLLRCLAGVLLEISAKEADVGKMIFPSHFLDALSATLELHLQLQDDVLVNYGLWCVTCHLTHDVGEIFGSDVHQAGVVADVSRLLIVALHKHHEAIEQLSHSI